MRALVTGADGFVGLHLCAELEARGVEVVAGARPLDGMRGDVPIELGDCEQLRRVIREIQVDVVYHLAAQAFVPRATADPLETYETNILGTARLVEAIRLLPEGTRPRLLFTSSGEVYGAHARAELPIGEGALPMPATPYAASKLAGEAIVLSSAKTYGFPAVVTRSFNHIGPGQSDRFVVAGFARRLAAIAAGGNPLFPVGDLSTQRDFLDVRDAVRAYADLGERGVDGELYNVCSGVPTRIQDILRQLVMAARAGVEIREDPALMRPADVPVIYGDNRKLKAATGWEPRFTLARSLRDVYEDARAATATA